MIDVFLVEGLKIFYRIGLAIIVLHKKNRGKSSGVKVQGQWHACELVLMCASRGGNLFKLFFSLLMISGLLSVFFFLLNFARF